MDRIALLHFAQKHYAEAIADELAKLADNPDDVQTEMIFEHAQMLNAIEDALVILQPSGAELGPDAGKRDAE